MIQRKITRYLKNEFLGWKPWEIIWLLTALGAVLIASLIFKNTAIGIITASTGVINVVLTGKGKLGRYLIGIVNVLLYAIISFKAKFYGVALLNIAYYFPMQFYGIYVWSRHMDAKTHEVEKRAMSLKAKVILLMSVIAGTTAVSLILRAVGDALPFVDALATVVSVIAMYISIKMYAEQWTLWIAVNSINTVMWAINYADNRQNMAMLIMYIIYLINAVIMYRKWTVEANK